MLVSVILDSCKKILMEYGEDALNLAVLEKVSGVGQGSIYQYFPNLEAIVAALFEREFREFVASGTGKAEQVRHKGLKSLLNFVVEDAVLWHDTMGDLHSSFYENYKLAYDVGKRFVELDEGEVFARRILAPAIARQAPSLTIRELHETAHLTLQGLTSVFFSALCHYPEKIHDKRFHRQLVVTALAFIDEAVGHPSPPEQ